MHGECASKVSFVCPRLPSTAKRRLVVSAKTPGMYDDYLAVTLAVLTRKRFVSIVYKYQGRPQSKIFGKLKKLPK